MHARVHTRAPTHAHTHAQPHTRTRTHAQPPAGARLSGTAHSGTVSPSQTDTPSHRLALPCPCPPPPLSVPAGGTSVGPSGGLHSACPPGPPRCSRVRLSLPPRAASRCVGRPRFPGHGAGGGLGGSHCLLSRARRPRPWLLPPAPGAVRFRSDRAAPTAAARLPPGRPHTCPAPRAPGLVPGAGQHRAGEADGPGTGRGRGGAGAAQRDRLSRAEGQAEPAAAGGGLGLVRAARPGC